MTISRWEPFRDLMTLREAMDRLFEESFVRPGPRWHDSQAAAALPIDAYVTDEDLVITATVPGLDPEDVEITIEGDTLTIKGEIKGPLDNVNYLLQERAYGTFTRTLRLNLPVQADKAEATFENGVLTLVIPKQDEARPKTIKVTAK
ncbi:MAG: Hsp20/alpha crystallin family protein [Chloroflexi bacterium]|jgi:HSP20 family protein|nr:Hsp20/alpha crystallin family protein [Chloroflexota bacterium]